jgi:CBS-domain-containing membrane protein
MKVKDIMTTDVIAVRPDAAVQEAARLMVDHGVSGLPVVDDEGRVVGIISDGDLVVRQKPRERVPWWRLFFADAERLARDYQKAAGTRVAEVMTRAVISVSPELPIESAALILDQHRFRRLPVVADGELVGIVSRGDLIKALTVAPPREAAPLPDDQIVREMRTRMSREPWVTNRGILVQAKGGVVSLWGIVASEAEKSALETMARSIEGVKSVDTHILVKSEIPYHYGV